MARKTKVHVEPNSELAERTNTNLKPQESPSNDHAKQSGNGHSSNGNGKAKATRKPTSLQPAETNGKTKSELKSVGGTSPPTTSGVSVSTVPTTVSEVCQELQRQQRQRAVLIKSRIMQSNRILHIVAGTLGYRSGLKEKERTKLFGEARTIIKGVLDGNVQHHMSGIINTTYVGIDAFERMQREIENGMVKLVKILPVAPWVLDPKRRGFGLLGLAIVVGECGDLSCYANPGKLWKRMGCAPWTFEGKTLMGATWKGGKEGKLNAEQWTEFGYSPRRRSISYLFGEAIVKQNGGTGYKPKNGKKDSNNEASIETDGSGASEESLGADVVIAGAELVATETADASDSNLGIDPADAGNGNVCGPYRARYDFVKVEAARKHPDWTPLRVHRHAMLLATKMLLRDLWVEWQKQAGTWTPDEWSQVDKVSGRYGE